MIKMVLVTDAEGRVQAAAYAGDASGGDDLHIALSPLPGQRLHTVEVPESFADLHGGDLHRALSDVVIHHDDGTLKIKSVRTHQHDQAPRQ